MSRLTKVARGAFLTLTLTMLVSGCVSLPDSSSVSAGSAAGGSEQGNLIGYSPRGPVAGASKPEIVEGYLQAMLAFPRSPNKVRQFLSPEARRQWDPTAQLLVYESKNIAEGQNGSVSLQLRGLGSIDPRGSWVSADPADDIFDMPLDFARIGHQWRITTPPAGTLLDADFFDRYYQEFSLYFFDPSHTLLTPDPVFLLLGDPSETATALVSDLLLGPTTSMAGVVGVEVPRITTVAPRVTITSSGLAEVPLTDQVLGLTSTELKRFAAQLTWTLRQKPLGISDVRVTSRGQVVRVLGQSDSISVDEFEGYDPTIFAATRRLYALSDGRLVSVTSSGIYPAAGAIGASSLRATVAAIDPTASRAALVTNDGTKVVVGGTSGGDVEGNARWFAGGHDLLKPSWDVHGLLWIVDQTPEDGAVVYVSSPEATHVVAAPGISGYDVEAFAVSRDGSRLAAVLGHGASARIVIAMVRRSPVSKMRVSLTETRTVVNTQFALSDITQLAWYSSTSVVVLAHNEGSDAQPYEVAIDGSSVEATGFLPVRPVTLAAAANLEVPAIIGTQDGQLYGRTPDQQWTPLSTRKGLFAPVYPG